MSDIDVNVHESTSLGVVVERIGNLRTYIEEKNADLRNDVANAKIELKADIGEVKKDTAKTNGRVTSLEDQAVKDAIYRGQVKLALWLMGVLITLFVAPIVVGGSVIYIQQKMCGIKCINN